MGQTYLNFCQSSDDLLGGFPRVEIRKVCEQHENGLGVCGSQALSYQLLQVDFATLWNEDFVLGGRVRRKSKGEDRPK